MTMRRRRATWSRARERERVTGTCILRLGACRVGGEKSEARRRRFVSSRRLFFYTSGHVVFLRQTPGYPFQTLPTSGCHPLAAGRRAGWV